MLPTLAAAVPTDCLVHFARTNAGYSYQIPTLSMKSQENKLRVTITRDLKASRQCTHAYSKANKILSVINRKIVYKSKDVFIQLLVRPYLEFGTAARSAHYIKDMKLLEKIQQEAQLSQRDRAMLRVIEYIAKSFKVIRNYTVA